MGDDRGGEGGGTVMEVHNRAVRLKGIWSEQRAPWLVRVAFSVDFTEVPVECLLRRKDEPMQVPSVRGIAQDAAAVHGQRRDASSDGLTGKVLFFKNSVAHVVVRDKQENH